MVVPLANTDIAELLAAASKEADGHRARAYASAARAALMWSEEAADVVTAGRSLTELERIGPGLARRVEAWIEDDSAPAEPPADRYDFLSFAAARARVAQQPLALRGDLQMHTTYSDGRCSVAEMAEAGAGRGYDYVAITDHSKGLSVAGGIDEETLALQRREIDHVNTVLAAQNGGLVVLRGLEMNIDVDGAGDMDPEALGALDLVLGSCHSALRRKEDQTQRYIAALRNPFVDVIGHPRGRRFNARVGIAADWPRVLAVAAEEGKAMEINAYPDRQDLNVELLRIVAATGGWVTIGTDAHNIEEMRFMEVGVAAALIAGIPSDRILNLLGPNEVKEWAASHRR
jgi:histidinol phosphatase-like PHP family hydrolase